MDAPYIDTNIHFDVGFSLLMLVVEDKKQIRFLVEIRDLLKKIVPKKCLRN